MWIRSQDKKHIVNAVAINVNEGYIWAYHGAACERWDGSFMMGEYSTERASQVLDEIQHHIESNGRNNLFTVYQMPEK